METTTTNFLLPRSDYEPLTAKLLDRQTGWHAAEDLFGRSVLFRYRDVQWLADCSGDAIQALEAFDRERGTA